VMIFMKKKNIIQKYVALIIFPFILNPTKVCRYRLSNNHH
jgi:hypothetical protein